MKSLKHDNSATKNTISPVCVHIKVNEIITLFVAALTALTSMRIALTLCDANLYETDVIA